VRELQAVPQSPYSRFFSGGEGAASAASGPLTPSFTRPLWRAAPTSWPVTVILTISPYALRREMIERVASAARSDALTLLAAKAMLPSLLPPRWTRREASGGVLSLSLCAHFSAQLAARMKSGERRVSIAESGLADQFTNPGPQLAFVARMSEAKRGTSIPGIRFAHPGYKLGGQDRIST
jgi:hypothetical protein